METPLESELPAAPSTELRHIAEYRTGHQRSGAVMALGLLSDQQAAPLLLSMLNSPQEPLRIAAVDALGLLRHRPATPRLVEVLDDQEAGGRLRARAAWSLGRLAEAEDMDSAALKSLTAALDNPAESVRLRAAEALATMPPEPPSSHLTQTLTQVAIHDPSTDIRLAAVNTLGSIGPAGRAKLRTVLESATAPVRAAAVKTYAEKATSLDVALLEQIAADDGNEAALAAIEALGRLGDSHAVPVLVACAEVPAYDTARQRVQSAALDALIAVGGENARQAIIRLYQDAELPRTLTRRAVNAIAAQRHDDEVAARSGCNASDCS